MHAYATRFRAHGCARQVFHAKAAADNVDLRNGRQPLSLPKFTSTFFIMQCGTHTEANNQLARFLRALFDSSEEDRLAHLFLRFTGLAEVRPLAALL